MLNKINHSSVLLYLNERYRYANTYHEHPFTLICDLLRQQRKHIMENNLLLLGWKQSMEIELLQLYGKEPTSSQDDIIEAVQVLNHDIYLCYKKF